MPGLLTVIDDAVSAVLHNKAPEAVVDNVEVPLQLFITLTVGANGDDFIVKDKILVLHPLTEV